MHVPLVDIVRPTRMQLPTNEFRFYNMPVDEEALEEVNTYFSLTAPPNTRLGRDARHQDEISAPMLLKRVDSSFMVCEVTVSVDFQLDWDQGGIVIFRGGCPGQRSVNRSPLTLDRWTERDLLSTMTEPSIKWARVAFELTYDEFHVSTIVAGAKGGLDWATTPATPYLHPAHFTETSMPSMRLKFERVESDLWIWFLAPEPLGYEMHEPTPESVSRRWRKCREVANFFDPFSAKGGTWVGCYASRPFDINQPIPNVDHELFVEFEELEIL